MNSFVDPQQMAPPVLSAMPQEKSHPLVSTSIRSGGTYALGDALELLDGDTLGNDDGDALLGDCVGEMLGDELGGPLGLALGDREGDSVGDTDGLIDGDDGLCVGELVGPVCAMSCCILLLLRTLE